MNFQMRLIASVLVTGSVGLVLAARSSTGTAQSQRGKALVTDADFRQAMKELSNWGRWGKDDELGAANLITPAKRKQAMVSVKEGLTVSLAHDIPQEVSVDSQSKLERVVLNLSPTGGSDRYQYTGSYHGSVHSHLDSIACHNLFEGKGWNGFPFEEISKEKGCPRGDINALKDGIVTRGILFDATLLPGKAGPQGWLEPGTAVHREDLEALETIERVKVSPGDVILLYTGRWKRRAALGPWKSAEGYAGYHADVAYFLKERGVAFIGNDGVNDVTPNDFKASGPPGYPVHNLAIVALGISLFDSLDLERAAEVAKRLKRWELLFTAAPLRVEHGMGSPVNPIATF